jgi:pyruvate dehydrogenase E2 component (dihydrolipoamide acetyltransferase)/2-oxoisovalerate dehydrogenase E2 component (dihydrolipoyl transacylase)
LECGDPRRFRFPFLFFLLFSSLVFFRVIRVIRSGASSLAEESIMELALPEIGEGVYEAELVRWLVKPGDTVKRGQNLLEVMTDKATMEVPSPLAGTITALRAEPGQAIKVGQAILELGTVDGAPAQTVEQPRALVSADVMQTTSNGAPAVATPHSVRAAPSVRQMARKLGIDLTTVSGSGPEGRVLLQDLTRRPASAPVVETPSPKKKQAGPSFGTPGTRIKLQGLRRRIADHMVHAKQTIPHYSYVDECDVTELVRLRNSLKDAYTAAGVKLTYLPFFVKAVVAALQEVPLVNASLDEQSEEIVLHDRYHVGIAVSTEAGLIVPVVRDADRKDIGTLAREIERLSSDARAGRARLDDLRGGTFTLTSVGNIGGLFSTPVINHPEVGILGIGKVVRRPVFDDAGQVRPADIVYLSLSFDHRVVDGAVGAAFMNVILRGLSNPAVMLLPEKP